MTDTIAKTVSANRRTGFAWFNYAMLAPLPVTGRININTASAQVLAALPGMNQQLARDIAAGVTAAGAQRLKPYKGPGDLLAVRGMNLDIFERIANLVCVDSDAFTLDADVQVVSDINHDGMFDAQKGDTILAQRRTRFVIVRKPGHMPPAYNVAERYEP